MEEAVAVFKQRFTSSVAAAVNDAPADALDSEGAEAITKFVPPAVKK
jgi:F-type H+-transporting ATPase subunit alpha